jgi:hypothetical protein
MGTCDMSCQPDWHKDNCGIYLPDPEPMTADDTARAAREEGLREGEREVLAFFYEDDDEHFEARVAAVERILADRVAEAERRGAERALREAADDVPRAPGDALSVKQWLRDRADRLARGAGDEGEA